MTAAQPRDLPEGLRLRELHSAREVRRRVERIAASIARDYADAELTMVVIAEGARRFAARIVESLEASGISPRMVVLRAWRTRGTELRDVRIEDIVTRQLRGADVLVVDDIADEGRTLAAVNERVREAKPRSLRTAVLVSKHARRRVSVPLDYVGFDVDDGWVVGVGMDLDGRLRDLDYLAIVEKEED